jgi:hypothetical protein
LEINEAGSVDLPETFKFATRLRAFRGFPVIGVEAGVAGILGALGDISDSESAVDGAAFKGVGTVMDD